MPNRTRTSRGFTLIELIFVVALIGILASIAVANTNAALLAVRVEATIGDLRNIENAFRGYGVDCQELPRIQGTDGESDPGLVAPDSRVGDCWRGPYISAWKGTSPLGGVYRYVGARKKRAYIRIRLIPDDGSAKRLVSKLEDRHGAAIVRRIRRRRGAWEVEVYLRDVPLARQRRSR